MVVMLIGWMAFGGIVVKLPQLSKPKTIMVQRGFTLTSMQAMSAGLILDSFAP